MEEAAGLLGCSARTYRLLENEPRKSKVRSNRIIKISNVTHIPLEALVDYLTETNRTKEMA